MAHTHPSRLTTLTVLLITTLGLAAFAEAAPQADNQIDQDRVDYSRCRPATLRGRYGLLIQGNRPAPGGGTEAMISTVVMNFDGRGGFTQVGTVHAAASGVSLDLPGSGSYEVAADCSGSFTLQNEGFPFPIDARFVVVDGGLGFFLVTTTRLQPAPMGPVVPILVSGTARRM